MASSTRSIKDFFRENLKSVLEPDHVITPAPPGFPEDMEFEWRVLGQDEIEGIYARHRKQRFARDERGRFIKDNLGRPCQVDSSDNMRALRNAVAESLVWPDMHNKELQDDYGVPGHVELVQAMFNKPDVWKYVVDTYNTVQGVSSTQDETEDDVVDELKN